MNEKWVADEIMAIKSGGNKPHSATHGNSGNDRVTLDTSQVTSGILNTARLPIATTSTTGIVKVGSGLSVTSDGTLSASTSSVAWDNITGKPSTFTPSAHNHAASEITSGTLAIARIPTGSSSSTVCVGNDYRLSNARTPTSHSHSASDLPTATTSSKGLVQVGSGLSVSNGVISVSSSGGGFSNITVSATTSSTTNIWQCSSNYTNKFYLLHPQKTTCRVHGNILLEKLSSSALLYITRLSSLSSRPIRESFTLSSGESSKLVSFDYTCYSLYISVEAGSCYVDSITYT